MLSPLSIRRDPDDEGLGMILVIGTMAVISILILVIFGISDRSLLSSRTHASFEGALSAAENGIDLGLARTNKVYDTYGADNYATPETAQTWDPSPTCSAPSVNAPDPTTISTNQAERAWARAQLLSIAANYPNCIRTGGAGQYVVLKPKNGSYVRQTIYAMGFSPSYSDRNRKVRLIKAEYLFAPYKPSNAILTSGNLELDASTTVTTGGTYDPTLAAVHTNGSITVPQGNPTVTGPVSSSQSTTAQSNNFTSNTGGKATVTPKQSIPVVNPLTVYSSQGPVVAAAGLSWNDLCANGEIRSWGSAGPCTGTLITTLSNGGSWHNWTYSAPSGVTPATWTASKLDATDSAVWYVHAGNIDVGPGNGSVPQISLLADSGGQSCQKTAGYIHWNHIDLGAPAVTNLFMLAEADLVTDPNWKAGSNTNGTVVSGLFVAGDQVNMQTSSAGAYGAVVAADQCAPSSSDLAGGGNVIKNPSVYYDPNAEAPLTDIIRTTLWLEFTS